MTPGATPIPSGARRAWALGALLVLSLLGGLLLASTTAVPARAATTSEECNPDPSTGCLGGTVRTAGGEPATGVALQIEGEGASLEVTTNDSGQWAVEVTQPGDYSVTLDTETLPDGETLRDPASNPRTVTVDLGSTRSALFPLGPPTGGGGAEAPPSPTEQEGAPPAGGDDEAEVAPESAAATRGGPADRVIQLVASGLIFGLLIALASIGLSLIYGTTGLSNFSHGEQVTLGALTAYFLVQVAGLPLLAAGAIAVLVGLLSGYLQDRGIWGALRRRGVGLTQQMIVTIGLSMAFQYTFNMFAGGQSLRIVTTNPDILTLGPVTLTYHSAYSVIIAVVVLVAAGLFLTRTRTGRATRAVSDNASLAAASGIDVDRIVRLVWTLGTGLAALGGVLMALYLSATRWNMGTVLLLLMFAAVTLGGLGTAFGALVGSLVIGLVVELSTLVIPSDVRYAAAMLILILVLLLRPQGILGRAERVG